MPVEYSLQEIVVHGWVTGLVIRGDLTVVLGVEAAQSGELTLRSLLCISIAAEED